MDLKESGFPVNFQRGRFPVILNLPPAIVLIVFPGLFLCMQGKLLAIEGCDGSGKHTQAVMLLGHLEKDSGNAVLVSFPRYETFFGELVKKYLSGEFGSLEEVRPELAALLYSLDRYSALPFLEEQLRKGKTVVCDRYVASNIAHQAAKFQGKEQEKFIEWIQAVEARMPKPTATVFLDLPVETSIGLMQGRSGERDIHEANKEYLEATRRVYLDLCGKEAWLSVDCSAGKGIRPRGEIHAEILEKLREYI